MCVDAARGYFLEIYRANCVFVTPEEVDAMHARAAGVNVLEVVFIRSVGARVM
jgi:hypothetical protein